MAALLGVIAAGTAGGKLTGLIWEGVGGKALTEFHYALMAMAVVASAFLVACIRWGNPAGGGSPAGFVQPGQAG